MFCNWYSKTKKQHNLDFGASLLPRKCPVMADTPFFLSGGKLNAVILSYKIVLQFLVFNVSFRSRKKINVRTGIMSFTPGGLTPLSQK